MISKVIEKAVRPKIDVDPKVKPIFAIHRIVYGNDDHAPASSIFKPVSEAERKELLSRGAARELSDNEAVIFGASKSDEPVVVEKQVEQVAEKAAEDLLS